MTACRHNNNVIINVTLNFLHLSKPNYNQTMNTLSKIFCTALLVFSTVELFAQTHDPRLNPYYSQEQIKNLLENDRDTYEFLINALNHGIFIADVPQEKKPVEYNGTLAIDPNETHTFLSLGLEITDYYQYFKIEGTEKMLVVLPKTFLENK